MRKLLIFIHIVPLLFSCASELSDRSRVFRYNQEVSIGSLDPAFAKDQASIWAVSQLYNGLVQLDENLDLQPCIAKRWEVSDDGLLYRFYLRNDVGFHADECFSNHGKNRVVISQDFVYSFRRIIDPELASPGAWIFNNKIDPEEAFVAVNDTVLDIRLREAFPPFLELLSMPYCSVVPAEAVKKYGKDFRGHPVGTGPFRFHFWEEGIKLLFARNSGYFEEDEHGRLPHLDGVEITFIENKQTAFMEFVQGKLDFFNGLDGAYKDELLTGDGELRPKYKDAFKLRTGPYLNTEYFGFMIDPENDKAQPQLLNKHLRKAISFSIDRKKMIRYLRNNIGTAGEYGFIPPGLKGFDDKKRQYFYSPDSVRKHLTLAGFPGGEGLEPVVLYTNKNYVDLTVFIQNQLKSVGIPSRIEINTGPHHREMVSKLSLPFFRGSWLADYPDAENYLALFYSKNFAPGGPNYTHYSNAAYDRLYEAALQETDAEKRYGLYARLNDILMEDAPVLVLFYDRTMQLMANNISGLPANAMNTLVLKYVRKQ
jgi:oligopeptide transport system substrate-binding protein